MKTRYFAARILQERKNYSLANGLRWFSRVGPDANFESVRVDLGRFLDRDQLHILEKKVHQEWELIEQYKINIYFLGDPEYPVQFLDVSKPPFILYVLGNIHTHIHFLSVVGSRDIERQTQEWIQWNLGAIVKDNITIISGGARGVDQAAHRAALMHSKPTIAILPSGLLNPYPPDFSEWITDILKSEGAVLSELPPLTGLHSHEFHRRNRLIAALAPALLVVQARRNSGSTMTARFARELGREIAVVPGFPSHRNWVGSCDILSSGAQMVRDAQDLQIFCSRNNIKLFPNSMLS